MENKENAIKIVKQLSSRMLSALVSYYIWKWIEQSRNINIGEEKVKQNLLTMNRQINFFQTALRGSFYVFVIDLSIFFDRQQPALSIDKVINIVNLSGEDKIEIEKIRKSQEDNMLKLKDMRDKEIAHLDMNVDRTKSKTIIYQETEELFNAVQKIFNIVIKSIDNSIWAWSHIEKEIDREMNLLFDSLESGEQKRLDDVKEKWK